MKARQVFILIMVSILILISACGEKPEPEIPDEAIRTKATSVTEKPEETAPGKETELPEETEAEEAETEEQPEFIWKYQYDTRVYSLASFGEEVACGHYCVSYIHHISDATLLDAISLEHSADMLKYSPDGVYLGAGQGMYGVLLTKLEGDYDQIKVSGGYSGRLAFSPDGSHIATCRRDDGIVRIWEMEGFNQTDTLEAPDLAEKPQMWKTVDALEYHPSGRYLAAIHNDLTIHIWDLENSKVTRTLEYAHSGLMRTPFAFSPNGKDMAFVAEDRDNTLIRLVTVDGGDQVIDIVEPTKIYRNMKFSPDGSMLAVATIKNTSIWDVASGDLLYILDQEIRSLDDAPFLLAFTDDGGHLAVGRADKSLELWRFPGADPIEPPVVDIKEPPPLSGDILFDTNSAKIKQEAFPGLEALAEELYDNFPQATIKFIGHTDSQGDDDSNMTLSINRAQAVMDWFQSWADAKGAVEWTLLMEGRGESELKVPDVDVDGNFLNTAGSLNRRVEIEIEP